MSEYTEIVLYGLKKHSLNEIYAGKHWTKRKKIKDAYKLSVKSQFKHLFSKRFSYVVSYEFVFKNNPLDASNTVYMLKMIEDIIFESDGYKVVKELSIKSVKGVKDCVKIKITKLN